MVPDCEEKYTQKTGVNLQGTGTCLINFAHFLARLQLIESSATGEGGRRHRVRIRVLCLLAVIGNPLVLRRGNQRPSITIQIKEGVEFILAFSQTCFSFSRLVIHFLDVSIFTFGKYMAFRNLI